MPSVSMGERARNMMAAEQGRGMEEQKGTWGLFSYWRRKWQPRPLQLLLGDL